MQSYVDRYTNPNIYKSQRGFDRIVKVIRNNSALAFLAFNTVTMLKQLPSLAFYMAYSNPADVLAGIAQTGANWKKTREFVEASDPQMRERSIERSISELQASSKGSYNKIIKKVGLVGMKGIMLFDKIATTAGWIAVYNNSQRKGLSHSESVELARRATLNSQPAAAAKDVASLYAEDNFLTIFLQFTNQLNQIWNLATYDAPMAIRNGQYYKAIMTYGSIALSAGMIWMISNRRVPTDDEDVLEIFTDQFFNTIPFIGPIVMRSMEGWNNSVSVLGPFEAIGKALSTAEKAFHGKELTDKDISYMLSNIYESFAVSTGMPLVVTKRMIKAFRSGQPVQTILFGGEVRMTKE